MKKLLTILCACATWCTHAGSFIQADKFIGGTFEGNIQSTNSQPASQILTNLSGLGDTNELARTSQLAAKVSTNDSRNLYFGGSVYFSQPTFFDKITADYFTNATFTGTAGRVLVSGNKTVDESAVALSDLATTAAAQGMTNGAVALTTNLSKAYADATFLAQSQTNTYAANILAAADADSADAGVYDPITTNGHIAGTLTLGQYQRTNTSAAITITSLTGATGTQLLRGILSITNASASPILVTWPVAWRNNLGFPSAYCTNACEMEIWVETVPSTYTNAAIVRYWNSASGVAP